MKQFKKVLMTLALLLAAGCGNFNSTGEIPAVKPFVLEKYLGIWYEAARMPHRFEKDMERVTAEYYLTPEGSIRVQNKGYRNGVFRKIDGYVRQKIKGTGELEVSFFRPFYGEYRIIALEKDYSAALVTSSSKEYAWILVRKPVLAGKMLPSYIKLLTQWGYDCARLEYPQMEQADLKQKDDISSPPSKKK